MKKSEVLDKATEIIASEANWCKHTPHRVEDDGTEQFCMAGAILEALGAIWDAVDVTEWSLGHNVETHHRVFKDTYYPILKVLEVGIKESVGVGFGVGKFNDMSATKHSDVLTLMKDTSQRLKDVGE